MLPKLLGRSKSPAQPEQLTGELASSESGESDAAFEDAAEVRQGAWGQPKSFDAQPTALAAAARHRRVAASRPLSHRRSCTLTRTRREAWPAPTWRCWRSSAGEGLGVVGGGLRRAAPVGRPARWASQLWSTPLLFALPCCCSAVVEVIKSLGKNLIMGEQQEEPWVLAAAAAEQATFVGRLSPLPRPPAPPSARQPGPAARQPARQDV